MKSEKQISKGKLKSRQAVKKSFPHMDNKPQNQMQLSPLQKHQDASTKIHRQDQA